MDKPLHKMTFTEMRRLVTNSSKESVHDDSKQPKIAKKSEKKRTVSGKNK